MRRAGAVLNGPLFGTNIIADRPFWRVAILPPMPAVLTRLPDLASPDVSHVEYEFLPSTGAWVVTGSRPVADDRPEPPGYPTIASKWEYSAWRGPLSGQITGNRYGLRRRA